MKFLKSWKTTLGGIAAFVVSALVTFGVFTPEDATVANEAVTSMIENIGAMIAAITGVIAIFSRDNDVSSENAGAK